MREQNHKIERPILIEEDLLFRGLITGGVTVQSGVKFDLRGMIVGDLDVERGAQAIIHGTVDGTVRNHGGYVELFGTVNAVVDLSSEAQTVIDAGALIRGLNP